MAAKKADPKKTERIERIENAIGSRGAVLGRDGSPSDRLQAAAAYFGGLGITVEPNEDALELALAVHGTDVLQFDTVERIAERRANAEKQQADADAAAAAAQAEKEQIAAALQRLEAERLAEQARQRRLADLRTEIDALKADAETKAQESKILRERAVAAEAAYKEEGGQ
jgi:hypothetical protein